MQRTDFLAQPIYCTDSSSCEVYFRFSATIRMANFNHQTLSCLPAMKYFALSFLLSCLMAGVLSAPQFPGSGFGYGFSPYGGYGGYGGSYSSASAAASSSAGGYQGGFGYPGYGGYGGFGGGYGGGYRQQYNQFSNYNNYGSSGYGGYPFGR
ncbi:heterogeneous nuclear ribonucleoprotein A2 homolog 1 isoform X1 [Drosophila takahashii]|uniref:heterogeneous nuclear ribonucleoprotein A2 homolog 1 isoform X1 n=2 Tax=Drosophila takahashii TaxID=29030 RepID=UPI0038992893